MSMTELVHRVCEIARRAGEEIMKIYLGSEDIGIESKADKSPLTLADRAANDLIIAELSAIHPLYPIISEENKEIPYEDRKDFHRCWMVDPLDGTKEFIKRNGEFTVNIALIEAGSPILGVVYVPVSGKMYYASKDTGAYELSGGSSRQLSAGNFNPTDKRLRVVASRSHMNAETTALLSDYDEPTIVSTGSSLKFILLATGQADIYPRIGPTMEWDTAAAHIILSESGGNISIIGTSEPLMYNKPSLLNPSFVACARQRQ